MAHAVVDVLAAQAAHDARQQMQLFDHRVRHADFGAGAGANSVRWLGTSIASLSSLQRVLVVGSFLRKDHPLFAQRIRQAARKGAKVHSINAVHGDWLMPMASQLSAAPSLWLQALADVAVAVARAKGSNAPMPGQASDAAQAIASSLLSGERKAVLLGNAAAQHPNATSLLALANWIAEQTGASVGVIGEAANSVGAQLVNAMPGQGGLNAAQMLGAAPGAALKACLLLNLEPTLDAANAAAATAALQAMDLVVVMSPFKSAAADVADVLLPIAPFTETSGTFVNAEGRAQSFHGVVNPLGDTRPAWKLLRVLGNMLGLDGFEFETSEDVRAVALGDSASIAARLNNGAAAAPMAAAANGATLERIADVPIYATDSLVRRATSLQLTADARAPLASLPPALWSQLGLNEGDRVRVSQGSASAVLAARADPSLAHGCVRVPAGLPATSALGAMFGELRVEKA